MSPTPDVQPLPYQHRRFVFIASLLIFCITVPLLVFYAIGYRFDFSDDIRNIKSVGGMYVTADVRDLQMFVDDMPVQDMRIFQNAAYIQNLQAGVHQIHTQADGVQTWVKEIPVFPHFVTEVQSFNMPVVPQIRFITPYKDAGGVPIMFATSTPITFASSSLVHFSTSTATTTLTKDPEYLYIASLFASSSALAELLKEQQEPFVFGTTTATPSILEEATTTKMYRSTRLYKEGDEVYIQWEGNKDTVPYYYCVRYESTSTVADLYGEHVDENIQAQFAHATTTSTDTESAKENHCRTRIRIDRKNSDVVWFDYVPGSRDFILMQLADGLYVVEADDRTWQNMQLLYPGDSLEVLVDGSTILVKDADQYIEVFTEVQ